jgi:hypothetical protein
MKPVTDPALLEALEGPRPVTDPAILSQLEGSSDTESKLTRLQQAFPKAKISKLADIAKAIPSAAARGVMDVAGAPADITNLLDDLADATARKLLHVFTGKEYAPGQRVRIPLGSQDIESAAEGVTGVDLYDPQTTPGRYVGAATRGATGAAVGPAAAIPYMMATGAAGGVGGEVGSDLTGGSPVGRVAGALVGSGIVGIPLAMRRNAGEMIREATQDVSPEDWARAQVIQKQAQQAGVPLMGPETLPQGPVQQLASDTMASKTGARAIGEVLEQRPGKVREAVGGLLEQVSTPEAPSGALTKAQKAATTVVKSAEKARTRSVRKFYEAAEKDMVPEGAIKTLGNKIDKTVTRVGAESESGKTLLELKARLMPDGVPETNVGRLDNLHGEFKEMLDAPLVGSTSPQRKIKGTVAPILSDLDRYMQKSSKNLAAGRAAYARQSQEIVDPLMQGDIGKIAGKGYDPQLTPPLSRVVSTLSDPKNVRPETIRKVYRELNAVDKTAFPGVARLYLENAFDQATQRIQSGDNRMMGANFVKEVFGTDQQRKNVMEVMSGVAQSHNVNPAQLKRGTRVLMDVLERTGKVPGIGSQTAGRLQAGAMASRSITAGALESVSTSPLSPVAKWIRDMVNRRAYRNLAEVFTAPDSVEKMMRLAQLEPYSKKAQLLVVEILAAKRELSDDSADQPGGEEE